MKIELINMLQNDQGHNGSLLHPNRGHYNDSIINKIIHIYKKYHPKANEIYEIEEKKNIIIKVKEKIIKDLENQGDEIKKEKKELKKQREELKKQREELENQKLIHKDKIKNLLERENKVFMKENIKIVHQELKEIAITFSNCIDILEPVNNILETQITNILSKLQNIFI